MNKLFYCIALFTFSLLNAQSTDYNTENLIVNTKELAAENYLKDSTAHAVYIYEKGSGEIDDDRDYRLVRSYEAKIKILDKEGIEEANISIPLRKSSSSDSKEELDNLKASTYKLIDGKIVKKTLSESKVYTEDYENYELVKFTFPDVEPGDIIVYSYELLSPFKFDFTTWYFQANIPKMHSEFTSRIPGNYEYYITLVGELKLTEENSELERNCISFGSAGTADCVKSFYAMKDVPAFKEEDYMLSPSNFKSRIKYELKQFTRLDGYIVKYTKNWEDVERELKTAKSQGRQWKRDGLVKDVLPQEITDLPLGLEKAKRIFYFVQEKYNWNEKYDIHKEMDLKDVLEDKAGSVLGINSLLHNLYEAEGFKVYPVMASTRNHGLPSRIHPVLSDFNYFFIALKLDDEEYLLDATSDNLDFGRLPYRALNQYARKIDFDNGSSWIDLEPKDYSRIVYRDSLKILPDGTASGFSEQILSGYHAARFREYLKGHSENEIFNNVANPNAHAVAEKLNFQNVENAEDELLIRYELKNQSQKINEVIYFNPFSFHFFEENPFKLDERHYPIDFGYKDSYIYSAIIEIPEGYVVEEMPETKAMRMQGNGGSLMFSANQVSDRFINVQCRLSFPKANYPSVFYDALKKFFDEIIAVQSQSLIVLKEIT